MPKTSRKRKRPLPESGPQRYRRFISQGQQGCPVGTWAVVEMERIAGCFRKKTQAEAVKEIKLARPNIGRVTVVKSGDEGGRLRLRAMEERMGREFFAGATRRSFSRRGRRR